MVIRRTPQPHILVRLEERTMSRPEVCGLLRMRGRRVAPSVHGMTDEDPELDRLRDEENRGEFAVRREERKLEAEERKLELGLDALRSEEERTAGELAAGYRRQHWHKGPPPPQG
jgi:hypothetical protein